jgi:hypothetical protein
MKIIKKTNAFCLFFLFLLNPLFVFSQQAEWKLVIPKYETADAFVSGINVLDHGADPTGTQDQTLLFQKLLDVLGSRTLNSGQGNGGVLYVPEGKYFFKGSLFLPKGVTIRGDWQKPVKGQPIKGTILMVTNGRGNDASIVQSYEAKSFITMQPTTAVKDLNIWYPDQDASTIVAYPPAILLGQQNYWGNDYTLVSNVTFINAFDGIVETRRMSGDGNVAGGAPQCYGIYGTPLRRGIEIDALAEVGRTDNVDFSPDYWAGSGLPGSPTMDGAHKQYIQEKATGITLRRIDWSYTCNAHIESYNTGLRMDWSIKPITLGGAYTPPNGHCYGLTFTNCKYGVYVNAASRDGMMYYDCTFDNCDYGFYLNNDPKGIIQIQGCKFNTKIASVYTPPASTAKVLLNQCIVGQGALDLRGGIISVTGCELNNEPDQIVLSSNARAIITGNKFKKETSVKNISLYECIIDHEPVEMKALPEFPYKNQYDFKQKPSGGAYYLATAHGVSTESDDNSDALQALLNQAKTEGGGLVFLPPGHYKFRKSITIPGGVELKGSADIPSGPTGPGSIMEIYAGKNDENGTPFINMENGGGIRGLVMNYPEQTVNLLYPTNQLNTYPYTIRGNADVYIVNIGFRASYRGIDLFTNKCDNHFVDYPAGHVFKTGIRIGGGTKGGYIYNAQFNQIIYGYGSETKWGDWSNSPNDNRAENPDFDREVAAAYAYCWNNLDFLVLEDCEDQILYNNFDFGSNRGLVLSAKNGKAPGGMILGQGLDQAMKAIYIEAIDEKGIDFINSQIVTAPTDFDEVLPEFRTNNRYIQTTSGFEGQVTFFGADFWGEALEISNEILGGNIEMQAGNYSSAGRKVFASVASDAVFDMICSNINPVNTLVSNSKNKFFIQSSIVNKGSTPLAEWGLWLNNMEHTANPSADAGAILKRTGWIASASVNNLDASKTLDNDYNTRWSTLTEGQKVGMWFKIDMQEEQDFTGIFMDAGSTNYLPVAYTVSISSDDQSWTEVANGAKEAMLEFEPQKARYAKIESTATSAASWRISEFFLINAYLPPVSLVPPVAENKDIRVWFSGNELKVSGTQANVKLKIFNLSGQQVQLSSNLPVGIYLVVVEYNGKMYHQKVMKTYSE